MRSLIAALLLLPLVGSPFGRAAVAPPSADATSPALDLAPALPLPFESQSNGQLRHRVAPDWSPGLASPAADPTIRHAGGPFPLRPAARLPHPFPRAASLQAQQVRLQI